MYILHLIVDIQEVVQEFCSRSWNSSILQGNAPEKKCHKRCEAS